MTSAERFYVIITVLSLFVIPAIALLIRMAIKWTKIEADVRALVGDVKKLVADKDRTHAAMLDQMKEDRVATNRRLEFLEHLWIERMPARR